MKVLLTGAEVFPWVKTGGLGDVLGALPQALTACGAEVRLLLPGFPAFLDAFTPTQAPLELGPLFGAARVKLCLGTLAHSGVSAYVVQAPLLYDRPGSPYCASDGGEWPDNLQRFALLGWVGAHLASGELDADWKPDLLHAHDWHAAMACAYLAAHPAAAVPSVFTIHNLAYQGLFDGSDFSLLGLPARMMVPDALEYFGKLSFMKAGLRFAQRVTTVSPSYAAEIATREFGCGLDGLVLARGKAVSGILNGVDSAVWDPQTDPAIASPFSSRSLTGKARCKAALQQDLGLAPDAKAPLFCVVSRLTSQKGLDLVLEALPMLLAQGAQLAVLGTGDALLEAALTTAAQQHPGRVTVRVGYDEALAHRLIAGADALLMPSRFEPGGLTQLYAMRYGTVPVVRQVGGLADTVLDVDTGNALATGFTFGPASGHALADAVTRTILLYRQSAKWRALMRRGMKQDFSWASAAEKYMDLYREMLPA